jgi:hypothetical protein
MLEARATRAFLRQALIEGAAVGHAGQAVAARLRRQRRRHALDVR